MVEEINMKIAKLISLQALTFLHPGTGQSTGVVDLPIQREVHTEFPMFAASGFKGSLRNKAEQDCNNESDEEQVISMFGAKAQSEDLTAGAFSITDARILAFPVRSLQNVFMWVTCPMILERLKRDCKITKLQGVGYESINSISVSKENVKTTTNANLSSPLVLEELAFSVEVDHADETQNKVNKVASLIKSLTNEDSGFDENRLVIINDDDFKYLVKFATQVSARIKLNDNKTTTGGGGNLWYEETLPPETLLYAITLFHNPRNPKSRMENAAEVANSFQDIISDGFIQIGGNETVGQGWCSIKMMPEQRDS